MNKIANTIIELTVRNHPGVMSHITGLFSRRAFNLEGILCGVIEDGSKSRMYLLVNNDDGLDQIIKQVNKLYDVVDVTVRKDYDHTLFNRLHEYISG
jgi:acetolactate synthase I/III small subunit